MAGVDGLGLAVPWPVFHGAIPQFAGSFQANVRELVNVAGRRIPLPRRLQKRIAAWLVPLRCMGEGGQVVREVNLHVYEERLPCGDKGDAGASAPVCDCCRNMGEFTAAGAAKCASMTPQDTHARSSNAPWHSTPCHFHARPATLASSCHSPCSHERNNLPTPFSSAQAGSTTL